MSVAVTIPENLSTDPAELEALTQTSSETKNCKFTKRCRRIPTLNEHRCSKECITKYPLHHCARLGKFEELKKILDCPNNTFSPLERDPCHGRTPLHYSCCTGNVEKGLMCVKILLQCNQLIKEEDAAENIKDYVNTVDAKGETALHLAAKNEATHIVIELLVNQADADIRCSDGKIPLSLIYKLTPDAMNEVLNQSISYVENCDCDEGSDPVPLQTFDFTNSCSFVCLDFGAVIGYEDTHVVCNQDKTDCKHYTQETHFLYEVNRKRMATGARRQILSNVLVQAFLHFKWEKIKRFCYTAILLHLIWLFLYIWTSVNIFVMTCPMKELNPNINTSVELNDENQTTESDIFYIGEDSIHCHLSIPMHILLLLLMTMSSGIAIKECFQLFRLRSIYFRFENIGQCIVLFFIFKSVPVITLQSKLNSVDYQFSAFGIFLAWTLTLCQLAKIPRFKNQFKIFNHTFLVKLPDHGVYVEILSRVFKKFLVFITIFSSLLVAFAFSFSILLPEKQEFSSFPPTMIKMLTMMTGELNYDDVFHNEDGPQLIYHTSSHILYLIFVVVATIILFNLLIGFTVSDIQGLQKDAQINQISSKLEQIFLMESFLLSTSMQRVLNIFCRGKGQYFWLLNKIMVVCRHEQGNLCYHTKIQHLPCAHRVKIRDLASKNCMAISDISGAARSKLIRRNYNSSFDSTESGGASQSTASL